MRGNRAERDGSDRATRGSICSAVRPNSVSETERNSTEPSRCARLPLIRPRFARPPSPARGKGEQWLTSTPFPLGRARDIGAGAGHARLREPRRAGIRVAPAVARRPIFHRPRRRPASRAAPRRAPAPPRRRAPVLPSGPVTSEIVCAQKPERAPPPTSNGLIGRAPASASTSTPSAKANATPSSTA